MVKFKVPIKDILGLNYYRYKLYSDNYNPLYNSTITITCQCRNIFGNPVANKEITLYENGSVVGSEITDEDGIVDWEITINKNGLTNYSVSNENISITTNPQWKLIDIGISYARLYVNEQLRMCNFNYYRTFGSGDADKFYTWHTGAIPQQYRPPFQTNGAINQVGTLYIEANGNIGGKLAFSFSTDKIISGSAIWHY